MKIIVKKVGEMPEIKEIKGTLEELQNIVGGYIESFPIAENIVCICNEEGKLMGLNENFIFNCDSIVGDVFFCSVGEYDFESLNEKQIENMMVVLRLCEMIKREM